MKKTNKRQKYTAPLHYTSLALAITMACSSQTQADNSTTSTLKLEEVLVTARRTSESIQDTPIAVSAFDMQTTKDLINNDGR